MRRVTKGLFFCWVVHALAGFGDNKVGVLVDEFLEEGMAIEGLLNRGQFLGTNVAGAILAFAPGLEAVVGGRVLGATAVLVFGKFAELHGVDGGDLGEDLCLF
jgi:hypothetical protein